MRETFWYFEYTQEQLEELAEQSRLAQGGVSIAVEEPPAYEGEILEYDDGGTDGSRLTNPTPIDQTPTDAGFVDIDLVLGVSNTDNTSVIGATSAVLRVEQHPSIYGQPLQLKFLCEFTSGGSPADNSVITATPRYVDGILTVEVAMNLLPDSIIEQSTLVNALENVTLGGNFLMLAAIHSDSTSPIIAFKELSTYNSEGVPFHDLCEDPKTFVTTAGNPDAQIESGLPYIEGIFEQGRILTISLVDITDRDTTFPYSFQWYREELVNGSYVNSAIDGSNGQFHLVSSADVEKNITVAVTYINNAGDATQKNSPPVFIVNSLPTSDITISAESFRVGNQISANIGPVSDRNTVKSISNYRWQRSNVVPLVSSDSWTANWQDIENSDNTNYVISSADQGRRIRFVVDVTDNLNDVQTITSETSQVINSSPVGTLEITGTPSVGSYLYASKNFTTPDVYYWSSKSRTYDWFKNGFPIAGASKTGTSNTLYVTRYKVESEDFGSQISVSVTYIDDRGFEETITSETVSIIGAQAEGLSIAGTNEVSGTISADLSDFYDPDISSETFYTDENGDTQTVEEGKPVPTEILYRWRLVEDNLFLTPEGNQYKDLLVSGSYYGKTIELSIKYPDPLNEGVNKISTAQTTVVNSEPVGEIVLTGSVVGVRLPITLSVDQVSDINGPYVEENANWDFNYSLSVRQRSAFGNLLQAVDIVGANASGTMKGSDSVVYTVPAEYDNSQIIATVTYEDGEGVTHTLTDAVEIPEVGYPTIDGILESGQQLTVNNSQIENLVSIDSIKWYRYNGTSFDEIVGETNSSYTTTNDDVEKYIKVEIVYQTNSNDTETRSSVPALVNNSIPVGKPFIESSSSLDAQGFKVGDTLSSSVGHITDSNDIQQFYDYQWYRQKNGHPFPVRSWQEDSINLEDIDGATNQTYTITEEDQLKRIGLKVKLRDSLDKIHQLNSGLSWRKVDYETTGFIRVKKVDNGSTTSAGIDDQLTVDYSNFVDLDGRSTTVNHVWEADGVVVQQSTNPIYIVKAEDYGKQISVTISYNDRQNGDPREDIVSTNVFTINDTPASGLYIQGEAIAGNTLTGDLQFVNEPDGLPAEEQISFQWYRDNSEIVGENTKSYTIVRTDYNSVLKLVASYTDGQGNAEEINASVLVGQSEPGGSVVISGNTTTGSVLSIDVSGITDVYGPETQAEVDATLFNYSLKRITADNYSFGIATGQIYGNQTAEYTIQSIDIGNQIYAEVTYLDGNGNQKQIDSNFVTVQVPPEENEDIGGGGEVVEDPDNPYTGTVIAQGAGLKTVKLLSDQYVITYGENGYNPDIESYTITATAYNHVEPVFYKFYRLTGDADVEIKQGPSDNSTSRLINTYPIYTEQTVYRVDTIEETEDSTIVASDLVIVYGIKE